MLLIASHPLAFIFYFGASLNILRVEHAFLRLISIYHEVWGEKNDIRLINLNKFLLFTFKYLLKFSLLLNHMMENQELS